MAKWGYVGWFPSETSLGASMPASKCAGNFASIGTTADGLTFYFSDGQIWMPGGSSLGNIRVPTGLDTTSIKNILQRVGTSSTPDAPWGVGRELVLPPGTFELVPYNAGDPTLRPRNYLYCGAAPVNYNKADYPMGYLWMTLNTGGTLDDVNTTFSLPAEPSTPPTGYKWAIRVWP